MKVLMGIRVIALISALVVVGLGAWCKIASSPEDMRYANSVR